jgi:hypothetical protein
MIMIKLLFLFSFVNGMLLPRAEEDEKAYLWVN